MEGNFSKYYRSSAESFKIRGYGSFTEEDINGIKADFWEYVTANYDKQRLSALGLEAELGEDSIEKIEFVFAELIKYFDSLGIHNIKCNEMFLVPRGESDGFAGMASATGGVLVVNPALEDRNLNQLVFLKVLAHELYHSTATVSFTITEKTSGFTIHRSISSGGGISYNTENDPLLFEEGMASLFEEFITPKIKELFLEETRTEYDDLVQIALDDVEEPELSDQYDIHLSQTDQGMRYTTSEYSGPREVVKYLISEIDNFLFLVEDARINRHTLALARAIEDKYGRGSYRRISTALTTETREVLEELKQSKKF